MQSGRSVGAPVRVLIVAPSLDILGGQSRQAVRLVEALAREETVEVGFQAHNPRLVRGLRWMQRVKYLRTLVTSLLYWAMLLARAWRYDVIHTFSAAYYSYVLAALPALVVAKLYRKKAVLNYRSGEADDHLCRWRVSRMTMGLADEVVVPSGYLVEVFARRGLRARGIYNIVELERFRFRLRQPLRPVFLTSRLLEPLYNVPCVLRAFSLVQRRYPEARLTVAADGWMRKELEQLADDLGLRNALFIGRVPFAKMPDLYDSADVYLTATDIDNMPGSITECMAAGVNVVTTDAGGIPYIMTNEETGLLVRRGDHQALAAAAIRLLEDNELASRLALNARQSCKRFTWPEVRDEWLKLYRELAQKQVQPRRQKILSEEARLSKG